MKEEININTYKPEFDGEFERLWVVWLRNSIGKEPQQEDLNEIRNPVTHYVQQGGQVFYATVNQKCVGVVAIKKLNKDGYEFCKLIVSNEARGKGIGRMLVEACIKFAKAAGGKILYLQSFNQLQAALKMYIKLGFVDSQQPKGMKKLIRTEIIMSLHLI